MQEPSFSLIIFFSHPFILFIINQHHYNSVLHANANMPGLTLGDTIPNLKVQTTHGIMHLHDYLGDTYTILFSHPCTSPLSLTRFCP